MLKEILKAERAKKGISQKELAKHIGVSQQTIGSWETGRTEPSQEMLKALASFFDISIDYLLNNQNPDNSAITKDLTKQQQVSYEQFKETAKAYFMGQDEDDMVAILADVAALFKESVEINKKKHSSKKNR